MATLPPKFVNKSQKDFVIELNRKVDEYFKKNNLSKSANGFMIFKTVFHLSFWIGTYLLLVLGQFDAPINYVLWAILGFFMAMVTVNIGHDAIHGAYSNNRRINNLLGHTFNLNGASAYMWNKMHNIAHHTYTNVDGFDEDIEPIPVIRVSPSKEVWKIHKYQHIYCWFFYGLATLSWVLIKDYVKFFKNDVGNYNDQGHPAIEYFYLFFYKFLNYSIFLIIPILVIPNAWWQVLIGFLIMHFVAGMALAIIFMLAHAVEETHFPLPNKEGNMPDSFAVHQLYTTANFSSRNRLASFLTGGLNSQIEHHLYPNICSIHYPAISKIVKETAQEFNHPYYESSFGEALKSHVRFLKKMGRGEVISAH
jgi:linoleoyl-CoA desaturase